MRIAVSGGHTHATAVALDGSSSLGFKVLACARISQGLNMHSRDPREIAIRFKKLTEQLSKQLGYSAGLATACESLCLTLPGAATDVDQKLAEAVLVRAGWWKNKVSILDDTWAGLIGGISSCRGVCAFSGTGSSVFVGLGDFGLDRSHKLDGWGPFLGDRGSGFQLAMKMFRLIAKSYDAAVPNPLGDLLLNENIDISSIDRLQEWIDQKVFESPTDWNIEVGKLARLATRRADEIAEPGDPAQVLVLAVAKQMTELICLAMGRFRDEIEDLPIVLQGGMFEHSKRYRNVVMEEVGAKFPNRVLMAKGRPLYGAALMVMLGTATAPSDAMIEEVDAKLSVPPDFSPFLYY